jgi:hypothetical protein
MLLVRKNNGGWAVGIAIFKTETFQIVLQFSIGWRGNKQRMPSKYPPAKPGALVL